MSHSEETRPMAKLIADAGPNEMAEIRILDGRMRTVPIERTLGRLEVDLPLGAYIVRFEAGGASKEEIVLLDKEGEEKPVWLTEALPIPMAAPLGRQFTPTSHEYQTYEAARVSREAPHMVPAGHRSEAGFFVFVREPAEGPPVDPSHGLSLHTLDGALLADFSVVGEHRPEYRWSAAHIALNAGPYLLQLDTGSGLLRQVVLATREWQTQLFFESRTYDRDSERLQADLASMSVLMSQGGFDPDRHDLYLTEVARKALSRDTGAPGRERSDMLFGKFQNPMLGLYGAHLALRTERINVSFLSMVFRNLLSLLGPHPDVLAFGWALVSRAEEAGERSDEIARVREVLSSQPPLVYPPMLRASWKVLSAASYRFPGILAPGSLAERVGPWLIGAGTWLLWRDDEDAVISRGMVPVMKPMSFSLRAADPVMERFKGNIDEALPKKRRDNVVSTRFGYVRPGAEVDMRSTLDGMLDALGEALSNPQAMDRLDKARLTDLERRVVGMVYPQADPIWRRMAGGDPSRWQRWVDRSAGERMPTEEVIKSVQLPATSLLRIVAKLVEVVT